MNDLKQRFKVRKYNSQDWKWLDYNGEFHDTCPCCAQSYLTYQEALDGINAVRGQFGLSAYFEVVCIQMHDPKDLMV